MTEKSEQHIIHVVQISLPSNLLLVRGCIVSKFRTFIVDCFSQKNICFLVVSTGEGRSRGDVDGEGGTGHMHGCLLLVALGVFQVRLPGPGLRNVYAFLFLAFF